MTVDGKSVPYLEPSLTAKNCSVSAVCLSSTLSELTKCTINFGTDPLYTQYAQSMSGVLNTVFQFSLIGSHSIYFHQATVNVTSTLKVTVQGELIAMPSAECTRKKLFQEMSLYPRCLSPSLFSAMMMS